MNYADIKYPDVANGKGVRVSLFVSGCTHHCCGCFNPETWNFNYGKRFGKEQEEKICTILSYPWVKGLSILGGEPFDNAVALTFLLDRIKKRFPDKEIWIYSGYTFEEIMEHTRRKTLIAYADVLVDGEFILEKKNVNLRFRGSENQRVIDVKKSFEQHRVVLYDLGE